MSRALKIILFLVFFLLFFEGGLFASYTIVTSQPPDPVKLIEMQLNGLSSLFNFGGPQLPTQQNLKVLNPDDVATALKSKTGLDGIDLTTLAAQTLQNTNQQTIAVNLTAMGYRENQTGGGVKGSNMSASSTVVIKPAETYSIVATATATPKKGGVQVDVGSIQIISTRKLYNNP